MHIGIEIQMICERLTLKHSTQFWQIWQNEIPDEKNYTLSNCHQQYFNWICHGYLEQETSHPGSHNSYVVSICALGHCFGGSGSIRGSRSQRHHEQTRFDWEVETLVYSDESRYLHRMVPGSTTGRHDTIGT